MRLSVVLMRSGEMIRAERLKAELEAAGLPYNFAPFVSQPPNYADWVNSTWHDRTDGWVRLDWPTAPTAQQEAAADAIIQAHDGDPSVSEILQDYPMTPRVLAAMCIRGSSHWQALSSDRKDRVSAIIDGHALSLINAVGWGE